MMSKDFHEDEHLPTHVAVCAQRYLGINSRLNRLEKAAYAIIFLMISGQLGLLEWLHNVLVP